MVHPESKPQLYRVTLVCQYCEWGVVEVDFDSQQINANSIAAKNAKNAKSAVHPKKSIQGMCLCAVRKLWLEPYYTQGVHGKPLGSYFLRLLRFSRPLLIYVY
jgi:hypothetical protein